MPFLAYRNEMSDQGKELVIPEEVADSEDVECPLCGGRMRPRGTGSDQRARHFVHVRSNEEQATFPCEDFCTISYRKKRGKP
jgi:hypothetical protein